MKIAVRSVLMAAGLAVAFAASARADILIVNSPSFVQPEENLLFNQDGLLDTGLIVQGVTNKTGQIFNIEGEEELTTPAAGQARVTAVDGGFTYALIYADDPNIAFEEFEANLRFQSQTEGFATVLVTNTDGEEEELTFAVGSGQNFFGILAFNFQLIQSVLITTTVDLMDIRQIRVGGVTGPGVPDISEPVSLLLFGIAATGAAFRLRRKRLLATS